MAGPLDRRARKLVERIRKNHADHEAVAALAEHYAKAGDQASLANLMEGFAETLADARGAADAYVRAADAALLLQDRPRAEALYERALAREPGHAEALDRALRVAESAQDYASMRRILGDVIRAVETSGAPRQQLAALHFRLGQVFETHFQDFDRATGLYRIAIDANPQFVNAMLAARRLYARAGNHEAVSVLYEFEIDAAKLPEDKHALLMALSEHKQKQCDDLDGAIAALRRACKLVPDHLSSLHRLADALVERSERAAGPANETDLKRAAEVFYQLARAVPRADAAPLLLRALALAPEHARAQALLHELRGHAANGGGEQRGPHAGVSQRVVDQRATRQVQSLAAVRQPTAASPSLPAHADEAPPIALQSRPPTSEPDRTSALSTSDLVPLRPGTSAVDRTMALSTQELIPLRSGPVRLPSVPPPIPAPALRAKPEPVRVPEMIVADAPRPPFVTHAPPPPVIADAPPPPVIADAPPPPVIADAPPPPVIADAPPPPVVADAPPPPVIADAPPPPVIANALPPPVVADVPNPEPYGASIVGEDIPVETFTTPHIDVPTRARVVALLESDPTRTVLEVNLGATTESNLYVDMGDRIADGGVFVATYQALPAGTPVVLHVTLPGNLHAVAHGHVTLRRESLDVFEDPAPGICIAFEDLTHDGLALLERFAAKRTPWLIDDD